MFFDIGFGKLHPRAVMKYKMLHSALQYSPETPSFQDVSGELLGNINVADYAATVCCDPVRDGSAELIQKVSIN